MKQSKHIKQPVRHRLWVRYKRERIDCCPQTSCVVCVLTVTTVIPTMLLSISNFKESLWGNSKWQCKMKWRIDLWAYKWKKKIQYKWKVNKCDRSNRQRQGDWWAVLSTYHQQLNILKFPDFPCILHLIVIIINSKLFGYYTLKKNVVSWLL